MIEIKDFYFPSSNGVNNIHVRKWLPETGTPVGIVQLAHGIVDHIARYDDLARFLAGQGYLVVGNDHLGHGLSVTDESGYGYFADQDGWRHLVQDLKFLHDRTAEENPPGLPYFLLGHSMGAFLVNSCLIDCPQGLDGAILCGAGAQSDFLLRLGINFVGIRRRQSEGLHHRSKAADAFCSGTYNRPFAPNRTAFDWVCSDGTVVDGRQQDPALSFFPTLGALRDLLGGIQYIQAPENLARMDKKLPVIFLSGDQDPVGGMGRGVQRAYRSFVQAGCRDVMLKLYPGGRHEILHEVNKQEVWRDILTWMRTRP